MARAYDSWGFLDKMHYHPDGSMKPEYKKLLLDEGMSLSNVAYVEGQKKLEVRLFNEREQRYLERHGIPYSEWEAQNQSSKADLESRQRKAIRNGEEISSLPMDIDPDDYYDQVGNTG